MTDARDQGRAKDSSFQQHCQGCGKETSDCLSVWRGKTYFMCSECLGRAVSEFLNRKKK